MQRQMGQQLDKKHIYHHPTAQRSKARQMGQKSDKKPAIIPLDSGQMHAN